MSAEQLVDQSFGLEPNWPYLPVNSQESYRRKNWVNTLSELLVNANKEKASLNSDETSEKPESTKHVFKFGLWRIENDSAGIFKTSGNQTAFFMDHPVWRMHHEGSLGHGYEYDVARQTSSFLNKVLEITTPNLPFGPEEYREGGWRYRLILEPRSNIESFKGNVYVANQNGATVFQKDLSGGLIIGKDNQDKILYPWNIYLNS